MESVADFVDAEEGSKRVWIFSLGLFRVLVAKELLPAHYWVVQLDVFFAFLFSWDGLFVVDEQKNDGLCSHEVLLDVREVRSVTVVIEQVEDLFSSENLPDLMENLKVVLSKLVIDTLHLVANLNGLYSRGLTYLLLAQHEMWLDQADSVRDLNQL